MGIIFNSKQNYIIDKAVKTIKSGNEQVYQFAGYPGTGKSVVLMAIIDRLKVPSHRVIAMALSGQAAIVMRTKGLYNARTAHSWLFTPGKRVRVDNDGNNVMNGYYDRPTYELEFTPKSIYGDIMAIDEAGTMPFWMKRHIESRGLPIIACGDLGQLPPVGDTPAYLYGGNVDELDEIMRQGRDSAILHVAERARKGLPIHKGFYGNVLVIDRDELTEEMILKSDILMCGKNDTRDKINKKIREELLGIRSDLPILGEKLICRKNNWNLEVDGINLANGLCGIVENMPGVHSFDGKTFQINFKPNMLDNSFVNLKCDYDYFIASHANRQIIKTDKYHFGEKFEFAYCITTHSAQGSQYSNVIYIEEQLGGGYQNNLNHVGVTRAVNNLIYVKQSIRKNNF